MIVKVGEVEKPCDDVRDLVRPALDAQPPTRLLVGAIPLGPAQGDYPASFNASLAEALAAVPEINARVWWVPETAVSKPEYFGTDGVHPSPEGYTALARAWLVGMARAGLVPEGLP